VDDVGHDLRLVLVGLDRVGKSAAGNTIMGQEVFESGVSFMPLTLKSESREVELCGRRVMVVDTPGLLNSDLSEEEVRKEMERSLSLSTPGPHAFLLVIQLGRFTEQEKRVMETLEKMLSPSVSDYTIVLFSYGDKLKNNTIDQFIRVDQNLEKLVQKCGGRYHVFNNNDTDNAGQVKKLLDKVDQLTGKNQKNVLSLSTAFIFSKLNMSKYLCEHNKIQQLRHKLSIEILLSTSAPTMLG
uniref:GTPase IMAP family member 8 n=1 Tax=Oncorhynchus kisutch TaxID=8019 RepID=A0A8C7MFK6_ONCKI